MKLGMTEIFEDPQKCDVRGFVSECILSGCAYTLGTKQLNWRTYVVKINHIQLHKKDYSSIFMLKEDCQNRTHGP